MGEVWREYENETKKKQSYAEKNSRAERKNKRSRFNDRIPAGNRGGDFDFDSVGWNRFRSCFQSWLFGLSFVPFFLSFVCYFARAELKFIPNPARRFATHPPPSMSHFCRFSIFAASFFNSSSRCIGGAKK